MDFYPLMNPLQLALHHDPTTTTNSHMRYLTFVILVPPHTRTLTNLRCVASRPLSNTAEVQEGPLLIPGEPQLLAKK